jgi:hypothetical protein
MPLWTPGGDRIVYWSDYETLQSKVVGADAADELFRSTHPVFPGSWTPGGEELFFYEFHPVTRGDIWVLFDRGDAKPWIATEFQEGYPQLSPDGRWLAYVSNESGRHEVYVQPYPGPGERITVSTDGGFEPQWSPDGRELFYRIGARVMAVSFQTSPAFRSSRPVELFEAPYTSGATIAAIATTYDVAPDGEHFLMIEGGEEEVANQLQVVLNWFEELKRLAPRE